jgi:hypothetical protein
MTNYKKALEEGFEAAKHAAAAREEINSILETFKREILEGSDGKISIDLTEFYENQSIAELMRESTLLGKSKPRRTYHALMASGASSGNKTEIARWRQSPDGYPCTLNYSQKEITIRDGLALEEQLANLVRDPLVGELLYGLLDPK